MRTIITHMDVTRYTTEHFDSQGDWAEEVLNEAAKELGFELAPHVAPVVYRSFESARQDLQQDRQQALERLGNLEAVRRDLDQAIQQQVWLCRVFHSHSWVEIGNFFHISRQAAEQRYREQIQIDDPDVRAVFDARAEVIEAKLKLLAAQARHARAGEGDLSAKSLSNLTDQVHGVLQEMLALDSERLAVRAQGRHRRRQLLDEGWEVQAAAAEPSVPREPVDVDSVGGES